MFVVALVVNEVVAVVEQSLLPIRLQRVGWVGKCC